MQFNISNNPKKEISCIEKEYKSLIFDRVNLLY